MISTVILRLLIGIKSVSYCYVHCTFNNRESANNVGIYGNLVSFDESAS